MISNQYQNQPNFQGKLIKTGIKLPQKKFNEVAKIFEQKTAGKSDMILAGRQARNDLGRFYHNTDAIIDSEDVASIVTKSIKTMFKKSSPKKIAEELINLLRRFDPKDKALILSKEINAARKRLLAIKCQLEFTQNTDAVKRLQSVIERMEASITKKEAQYAKIKPARISDEWCC